MSRGAARLRRGDRVRESKDFRRISRQGRRKTLPHFVVLVGERWCTDREVNPALGITVGRKVGTAVRRNHLKRRVREWFRRERSRLPRGSAVVVIARRGAAELDTAGVRWELEGLLR